MKSIIYILIVVLLGGMVVSALPKSMLHQKRVVKIQSVDESPNANLFDASCSIITSRLKDYGLQGFEVSADKAQKTIEVAFRDKVDLNEILPLMTAKGKIEFYETQERKDVITSLKSDDKLFAFVNISPENPEIDHSSAILGYCKLQNKSQVDSIIAERKASEPDQRVKYLWGERTNNDGNYRLYMLKPHAAMDKSQISETGVEKQLDKKTDQLDLMISFNKNGTLVWQSLSKNNIGKSIAIVIDNVVYSAPKVMGEINNGKCVITGNFSSKEIFRLKSLIGNDELPLAFNVKQ